MHNVMFQRNMTHQVRGLHHASSEKVVSKRFAFATDFRSAIRSAVHRLILPVVPVCRPHWLARRRLPAAAQHKHGNRSGCRACSSQGVCAAKASTSCTSACSLIVTHC